jgi:hypothetical protein
VTTPATVTVNDPVLAPAGTTTGDGTVTFALSLSKVTEAPPLGAAALSVIVQVELPAPVNAAGLHANPLSSAGTAVTLTAAEVEAPFAVAVIVTGVVAVTLPAVAGKVAVVPPATTVTEAGTARAVLLSEMETDKPPVGAALFKPRVQVVAAPDTTVAGEQFSVEGTAGAMRLREALAVVLFRVAVSTAVLSVVTVATDAVKLAVDAPAATVTDAGIVAMALSSAKVTTVPPVGAAPVSATVQVADPPEFRVAGVQVRELRVTVIVSWTDADLELPFNTAVNVAV